MSRLQMTLKQFGTQIIEYQHLRALLPFSPGLKHQYDCESDPVDYLEVIIIIEIEDS